MSQTKVPQGDLVVRTLAMPENTNPNGDIFGGWVVSQMDLAGASLAFNQSRLRIVTVAIDSMSFIAPVKVGDFISCYAKLIKVGTSSMRVQIQAWVSRRGDDQCQQVTAGIFTYVAVDVDGRPVAIDKP